ncbi:MAG: SPOR domain-containing protein [Mangrovibacterium sp.]
MEILTYIQELLLLNDCVIIPQFGGFVANYEPATVAGNSFAPPSSSVSFNSKLNFNDGLLINQVSTEESIPYLSAKRRVESMVAEINYRLIEGESITIPAVGSLQYDDQRQLIFSPAKDVNLNINAYGLSPFSYQSLLSEKLKSTMVERVDGKAIRPAVVKSKALRRTLWATPVLIALLAIPFHNEIHHLQESNVIQLNEAVESTTTSQKHDVVVADTNPVENSAIENSTKTIQAENPKIEVATDTQDSTKTDPTTTAKYNSYFLIAGSFRNEANANSLVKKLRQEGFDAANIGVIKGLNYVSAGAYQTIEEAQKANLDFSKNNDGFSGSWIYKSNS